MAKMDPENPTHVSYYGDADTEEFHAHHNWQKGCRFGRTAGSATLECDTHNVFLTQDIPILLRDI